MRFLWISWLISVSLVWGAIDWRRDSYYQLLGLEPFQKFTIAELGAAAARARDASKRDLGLDTPAQRDAAARIARAFRVFENRVLRKKYEQEWQRGEDKKFFSALKIVKPEARRALFEKVLATPRSDTFWFSALNMLDQEKGADRGRPAAAAQTFALLLEQGLPRTAAFERAVFRRFQNEDYYTELLTPLFLGRKLQVPKVVSGLLAYAPNPRDVRGIEAAEIVKQLELDDPSNKKWELAYDELVQLYTKTSFTENVRKPLLAPGVPHSVLSVAISSTPLEHLDKTSPVVDQYVAIVHELLQREPTLVSALWRLRLKPGFHPFLEKIIALANRQLDADSTNLKSQKVLENLHQRFPKYFPDDFLRALLERCRKKNPPAP